MNYTPLMFTVEEGCGPAMYSCYQLSPSVLHTCLRRCPQATNQNGQCPSKMTILANFTRNDTNGVILEEKMCIPVPQYDTFNQIFWCV